MLTHAIGFVARGGELLMLNRVKAPLKGFWHGIGAELKPGEDPLQAIFRKIREVTGMQVRQETLRFAGIVLLDFKPEIECGAYVFVLHVPADAKFPETPLQTEEGMLHWLPQDWLCAPDNHGVSEYVRRLLPVFLEGSAPHEYHVVYDGNNLAELEAFPLYTETAAK